MNINCSIAVVLATRFMEEVLDSVRSLQGLAFEHGTSTLVDLAQLQHAIVCGRQVNVNVGAASKIEALVNALPSSFLWRGFLRTPHASEKRKPFFPLVLQTGVTCIDQTITPAQAMEWLEELEALCTTHFDYDACGPVWSWRDCHETDQIAFLKLAEFAWAPSRPAIDSEQLSCFHTPVWRQRARPVYTQVAVH